MSDNGNAPAYPVVERIDAGDYGRQDFSVTPGLTKREAFAMAAMQGMYANHESRDVHPEIIARSSVAAADALLAELAK